jgi:hypothetical protein
VLRLRSVEREGYLVNRRGFVVKSATVVAGATAFPLGTDIELISYPHGMAYQATAPIPLWDPRDNHP